MSADQLERLEGEKASLPELLNPAQLQDLLQGQDYHMMETEIEAILLKAKTEARLRERSRIKEITESVRLEAQRKLKYHVSLAQKEIREELNQRVTAEVKKHATLQKAIVTYVGDGAMIKVIQQQTEAETFSRALQGKEVEQYKSMFAQWDVDGDGNISYSEFLSVMRGVAERQGKPFNEKRVQAMFALADLDKNGSVDFAEFLVMQAQKADRGKLKAELDKAGAKGGTMGKLDLLKSKIDGKTSGKHSKRGGDGEMSAKRAGKQPIETSDIRAKLRRDVSGNASDGEDGSIDLDSTADDDGSSVISGASSSVASTSLVASIAKQAESTEHETGTALTQPVDLGPHFLREYLRFNRHGDGRLEMEQFIAVMEATLLRRNLRVFRKQLEGMFKAADFDEDGVVDLRQFVLLDSVKKYFDTLQRREIAQQQQNTKQREAEMRAAAAQAKAAETAARAAAQAQAAAAEAQQAVAAAGMYRLHPGADPSCDAGLNSSRPVHPVPLLGLPGQAAPQQQLMPPGGMMADPRALDRLDNPLAEKLDRIEQNLQLALQMGGSPDVNSRRQSMGSQRLPPRDASRSRSPPGRQSSVIYLDDYQRGGSGLSAQGEQRAFQSTNRGGGGNEGTPVATNRSRRGGGGSNRHGSPAYHMDAQMGQRDYVVRQDGAGNRSVDQRTHNASSQMHNFISKQADALSAKQVNPNEGIAGRLASTPGIGFGMRMMGFDINNQAQAQPHVGAVIPGVSDQVPRTPQTPVGGRGASAHRRLVADCLALGAAARAHRRRSGRRTPLRLSNRRLLASRYRSVPTPSRREQSECLAAAAPIAHSSSKSRSRRGRALSGCRH